MRKHIHLFFFDSNRRMSGVFVVLSRLVRHFLELRMVKSPWLHDFRSSKPMSSWSPPKNMDCKIRLSSSWIKRLKDVFQGKVICVASIFKNWIPLAWDPPTRYLNGMQTLSKRPLQRTNHHWILLLYYTAFSALPPKVIWITSTAAFTRKPAGSGQSKAGDKNIDGKTSGNWDMYVFGGLSTKLLANQ